MFKIFMIILSIIIFCIGLYIIAEVESLDDIGTVICLIAGLLFLINFFSPIKADASGYTGRGAGISKVMDEMLYNAMHDYYVVPDVSENDIELLARLITAEVGYSSNYNIEDYERAAYLTGSVVINRMHSCNFPATLEQVIYQNGQYACTWDGNIDKEYDDIAFEIAEDLLANGTEIPENVIYQSQFIQGSGIYEQIGNIIFCYQ